MKRLIVIAAAIGMMLVPLSGVATTDHPFKVGEKLTYVIYWGPISVGRATLEVRAIEKIDGNDCYHLVSEARTTGLGDVLFRVRSTTESWLDVKGLFTRKYTENRSEGKSRHNEEVVYDYVRKQAIIKDHESGKEDRLDLDGNVLDAISLLYVARTQPLKLESTSTFTVNAGKTNYKVGICPDEKKDVKARAVGNISAVRIEPNPTLKIVAKNKGRAWFWISDDERHLPLLAISKMKIGSARLELTEIEPKDPKEEKTEEKREPEYNFEPARRKSD